MSFSNEAPKESESVEMDPLIFLQMCSVNFENASRNFMKMSEISKNLIKAKQYERLLEEDPTRDFSNDPGFIESREYAKNVQQTLDETINSIHEALDSLKLLVSSKIRKEENN
ncbi:MAG: hypothetical protein II702_11040, partial [Clostridia bacterium]|nr:hypothetical protein [Clostridia bacterium]